ncbi:YfhO family protein [Blastopirellula sp. J2-11]|uniref:YfhO family protein n=1 Tax=Blastopirellula sp. J2-11 TaxID=2943192 RepID=UPI0021C814DF|nr:YfhO family protein [Blastopirellula sp. J2-11]UUO08136.1 YfhO family protein [Blastopirellula sp. J2-11]
MSSRARRFRLALLPLLPLAALLMLFFGPAVIGDESFLFRDAAHFYYPLFAYIQSVWGEGQLPLWNPYDGVGMPLLAEPSASVFYPGKLLFAFPLSFASALRWYVILHFALAYLTTYNCTRRSGVSRSGAVLAAITYSFGGYVVATHANVIFLVGAAWAPLALYCGIRIAREEHKPTAPPLLALSLAMMILGGDPQAAFHLALIAGVFFVCVHARLLRTPLSFLQRGKGLAAAITLAAAVSSVQILPTLQWSARSRRALVDQPRTVYDYARQTLTRDDASAEVLLGNVAQGTHERESYQFSFGPWRWPELVWPNFSGRMYPENHRWADAIPAEGRVWAPSLYIGGASLALALIGAWSYRRHSIGKLLIALSAIGVIGSLGWYGLGWLLIEIGHDTGLWRQKNLSVGEPFGGLYWLFNVLIPGYASFRYPAKLWLLASLAGSWLVGFGFDAERERKFRWLTRLMLFMVAISGLAVVSVTVWKSSLIAALPDTPANLLLGPLDKQAAITDMQLGMLQAVGAAMGVLSVLLVSRRRQSLVGPLFVMIVVLDLYAGLGWTVQSAPTLMWRFTHYGDLEYASSRWYRTLSANDYPQDFAAKTSPDRQREGLVWDRITLFPRYHLLEKVGSIAPSNSLAPADYWILLNEMTKELGARETANRLSAAGLISADTHQFLATRVTPRAWIADSYRRYPINDLRSRESWREAAQMVIHRADQQAIVHNEHSPAHFCGPPRAEIVDQVDYQRMSNDEIRLNVALSKPSYVLVQEYYDPAWLVEIESIDGSKITTPTERANVIFQAVALPAGMHRVTLRYMPTAFYWGAAISIVSGLLLICWGVIAWRRQAKA